MTEGGAKRKAEGQPEMALVQVKKQRTAAEGEGESTSSSSTQQALIPAGVKRTSSLAAPIMQLEGHGGEVYALRFDPTGVAAASASFDKQILLWNTQGECVNHGLLRGHKNAVLDLAWSHDGARLLSASADKTAFLWDTQTDERVKKCSGHTAVVNSCDIIRRGPTLLASGSDDSTAKLWDVRSKHCVQSLKHGFQVTSVVFDDSGDQLITGSIDNVIRLWDLRKGEVAESLTEHTDTITGLSVSNDGSFLLSNSMDNTLRIWDLRAFVMGGRCTKVLQGHQHNFEQNLLRCAWSPDGKQVTCGSSDRFVYIWDAVSGNIEYKLPGHKGSVNDVAFHPTEPVIGSASSDKTIFLGELGGA